MSSRLWKKSCTQDGFTLIELIVVVAILGILAAVLTPRVMDAVSNAKVNAALSSAKQIQLAMERYAIANDGYPATDAIEGTETEEIDDLIGFLAPYTNIDPESMTQITYENKSTTVDPIAQDYSLDVVFAEGDVNITITPDSVTENE